MRLARSHRARCHCSRRRSHTLYRADNHGLRRAIDLVQNAETLQLKTQQAGLRISLASPHRIGLRRFTRLLCHLLQMPFELQRDVKRQALKLVLFCLGNSQSVLHGTRRLARPQNSASSSTLIHSSRSSAASCSKHTGQRNSLTVKLLAVFNLSPRLKPWCQSEGDIASRQDRHRTKREWSKRRLGLS